MAWECAVCSAARACCMWHWVMATPDTERPLEVEPRDLLQGGGGREEMTVVKVFY